MENEFIPYEQALDLKELGFDEFCFAIYNTEQNLLYIKSRKLFGDIKTPLYQQAFRWFRKKYNLYCQIDIYSYSYTETNFEFDISNKNNTISEYSNTNKSYEEAELKALKKLIEIVKNK